MDVPACLRTRVLAQDRGEVRLALDDDRGARRVVVGLGTLAVGTLGTGWTLGGPVWSWVGVLSVPVIAVVALGMAVVVGRRTIEVHVDGEAITVAARRVPLAEVEGVRLHGSALVLEHPSGPLTLQLSGEEQEVRDALRSWLDEVRARAR